MVRRLTIVGIVRRFARRIQALKAQAPKVLAYNGLVYKCLVQKTPRIKTLNLASSKQQSLRSHSKQR